MPHNRFELLALAGEPFERGRQHGTRAAHAIRENVAIYLDLIEHHAGLAPERALAGARAFEPALSTHAPALVEEMRGIAAGAGCPLEHVLLINARSELMGTFGSAAPDRGECTSLAATPASTAGGHTLLAQNWDWHTAAGSDPLLLHIHLDDGLELLTLTEAGQVGKIGLNSAGLGVCLNFLSHSDVPAIPGLPVHVLLRLMLESPGLDTAVHLAYALPRAGSANVLLAHAAGDILDLELTPLRADFLYPDAGWLAHANHFESPRLRGGDLGVATSTSTVVRAARARRMMAASAGTHSVDTLRAILTDHAYGPMAICRHGDPAAGRLDHTATRASVVMDLDARVMHLAAGLPCNLPFDAYALPIR